MGSLQSPGPDGEAGHHAPVAGVHAPAVGVKDARHLDVKPVLAVSTVNVALPGGFI
ncbi:hypothetical protein GH984_10240 [Spiribacter sp. C176]|uniref:Uncharacterized protein n=1 Tax=Spiribacter salilacus TaxID=2664894 RepID=A0A6N7QUJ3_9GAMM|nr:hypothetical protein [Spiribacter salilacus]